MIYNSIFLLLVLLITSAQLPDMDFPINTKAEGRVLVPWEHQMFPNLTIQDSSGMPVVLSSYSNNVDIL